MMGSGSGTSASASFIRMLALVCASTGRGGKLTCAARFARLTVTVGMSPCKKRTVGRRHEAALRRY